MSSIIIDYSSDSVDHVDKCEICLIQIIDEQMRFDENMCPVTLCNLCTPNG
jgi:hypothetical protein